MGSNTSKKAPQEEAREDSSTDLEEEDDKISAIENENVPAVKATGQDEEQDGNDEKWWDQPVAKEKKGSRRVRRNKRSRKVNSRSRSSSKEERDNIWDTEEVIDVEDEDLVTGIREKQRWAWTENGQGRMEDNEEEEPEAGAEEEVKDSIQSNSKKNDSATNENAQASDEQINNRTFTKEQFKGQIVTNLSSKHVDKTVTNTSAPNLQEDAANRSIREQSNDQTQIYNWPQESERVSSEGNDILEKTKKRQREMDIQDRRDLRKSYRKRIKFWTEENLLRRARAAKTHQKQECPMK